MVLGFSISKFFTNKNSQGRKLSAKKYLLEVIQLKGSIIYSKLRPPSIQLLSFFDFQLFYYYENSQGRKLSAGYLQ